MVGRYLRESSETKAKLAEQGFYPVGSCGADFAAFVHKQPPPTWTAYSFLDDPRIRRRDREGDIDLRSITERTKDGRSCSTTARPITSPASADSPKDDLARPAELRRLFATRPPLEMSARLVEGGKS